MNDKTSRPRPKSLPGQITGPAKFGSSRPRPKTYPRSVTAFGSAHVHHNRTALTLPGHNLQITVNCYNNLLMENSHHWIMSHSDM